MARRRLGADRLAATFAALIPLEVVTPFRVVLVAPRNPHLIANDLAVPLDHSGKFPDLAGADFFQDIDAFGVLFGPTQQVGPAGHTKP